MDRLDAFNIIEGNDGRSRWIKIGTAFVNRDGSINVKLDCIPVNGEIQLRATRPVIGEGD